MRAAKVGSDPCDGLGCCLVGRVYDNVGNLDVRRTGGGIDHVVGDVLRVQWLDVLS